jgi:hypothetical protein
MIRAVGTGVTGAVEGVGRAARIRHARRAHRPDPREGTVESLDDFLTLVREEFGLPVTSADADLSLSRLPDWDSMHVLWLATLVEQRTGRPVSVPGLLGAGSLGELYAAIAGD